MYVCVCVCVSVPNVQFAATRVLNVQQHSHYSAMCCGLQSTVDVMLGLFFGVVIRTEYEQYAHRVNDMYAK
jgi:hypothetical protein